MCSLCCCRSLSVFQRSYEVFQLLSLSFLAFPRENSVILLHHFADITIYVKFYLTSPHPHISVHHNFPYSFQICYNLCSLCRRLGSIPGSGRSSGERNSKLLQNFYLENPMAGGAWWATPHGGRKESDTTELLIYM